MPNLAMLPSRDPKPLPRAPVVTAVGVSYQHPLMAGLPVIPEAVEEATTIARIFQAEPLLDEQATVDEVLRRLPASTYVHIAAHGANVTSAPALQCLYLAPSSQSDGRLRALDLLALDLTGVRLVTIGACEAALGRFDLCDNLRGLTAALFLRGVKTVISPLWEVHSGAAFEFFCSLYQQLGDGVPLLESFHEAQMKTRARFPRLVDWGSFQFTGDWT